MLIENSLVVLSDDDQLGASIESVHDTGHTDNITSGRCSAESIANRQSGTDPGIFGANPGTARNAEAHVYHPSAAGSAIR